MKEAIVTYYGSYRFEKVHPLQCGVFRRKIRTTRRSGLPLENPLVFYARRAWEIASTYGSFAFFALSIERFYQQNRRSPAAKQYTDLALQPVTNSPEEESLQMYELTDAAKTVVAKTKSLASRAPAKLLQLADKRVA